MDICFRFSQKQTLKRSQECKNVWVGIIPVTNKGQKQDWSSRAKIVS